MREKIGIADVGGGLRGIYAAGVLDYCLDNSIEFALRKQYMGLGNFIKLQNDRQNVNRQAYCKEGLHQIFDAALSSYYIY